MLIADIYSFPHLLTKALFFFHSTQMPSKAKKSHKDILHQRQLCVCGFLRLLVFEKDSPVAVRDGYQRRGYSDCQESSSVLLTNPLRIIIGGGRLAFSRRCSWQTYFKIIPYWLIPCWWAFQSPFKSGFWLNIYWWKREQFLNLDTLTFHCGLLLMAFCLPMASNICIIPQIVIGDQGIVTTLKLL